MTIFHIHLLKCKPPVYKNILKVDKDLKQCLNINDVNP